MPGAGKAPPFQREAFPLLPGTEQRPFPETNPWAAGELPPACPSIVPSPPNSYRSPPPILESKIPFVTISSYQPPWAPFSPPLVPPALWGYSRPWGPSPSPYIRSRDGFRSRGFGYLAFDDATLGALRNTGARLGGNGWGNSRGWTRQSTGHLGRTAWCFYFHSFFRRLRIVKEDVK